MIDLSETLLFENSGILGFWLVSSQFLNTFFAYLGSSIERSLPAGRLSASGQLIQRGNCARQG
jgi:hypothetical protein